MKRYRFDGYEKKLRNYVWIELLDEDNEPTERYYLITMIEYKRLKSMGAIDE